VNAIDLKLEEREITGNLIKVGLIGCGQMGQEIVAQVGQMVGMEVLVVVDVTLERAQSGYSFSKKQKPFVTAKTVEEATKATRSGNWVVATDFKIATNHPDVEVVIEATGVPEIGARVALDSINNRKHIVMMTVECDVTVGPILRQMADNAGIIYSLASGDEPAALIELYRFARAIGHQVICAGKGKNNPLDIYATPLQWASKAKEHSITNPRLLVEFVDGSKTMVEMCAVSNATGLVPDIRGMHGPKALVNELTRIFCPKKDGGILEKTGVVEYAIGDIHPGVFVIFTSDNQRIKDGPAMRALGKGPYYLLYRPYHLCSGEVPLTVARTVFYHESSGHPLNKPVSECITVAKKDLKAGEALDMIGEYCYRGSIELADIARAQHLLPLGLAKGCVLKQDVPCDTFITYDMVQIVNDTVLLQLRKIQDMVHWS
jgi:predicted homoserine dehydrogenase-like protein